MEQQVTVKLNDKFKNELAAGYPLIVKDAVEDADQLTREGMILKLTDKQGRFIAKGYYGNQNKGIGWVLTHDETEAINQAFFERKLTKALRHRGHMFNDTETTAFRVFNGEGDGIGGVI